MSGIDEKQIQKWVEDGTITQEQAKKMLADSNQLRKERTSNKLIIMLSTVGAALLGIGALLFMSSNWMMMSNTVKVLMLTSATFLSFYLGYLLQYKYQNYPRVGSALIFLGALLFGTSVFLVAQMYHVNANNHTLVLIWILGVLPLVYAFGSLPVAGLVGILFFLWVGLFMFRGFSFESASEDFYALPVLYLICGNLFFHLGGLHYFSNSLQKIARLYRLIGIKVAMASVFVMTFEFYSGEEIGRQHPFSQISLQFTYGFVIFYILTFIATAVNLYFNPSKSKTYPLEDGITLFLSALAVLFFSFPAATDIYTVIFNVVMAGLIMTMLVVGYLREDLRVINIGMGWLWFFGAVKYFDFFWDLLPRSLFFLVGGLILVIGGVAFERKRNELKKNFAKIENK